MKTLKLLLAILLLCGSVNAQESTKKVFELKGCYPLWKQNQYPIEKVPLDQLTELWVCFTWAESDGSFNTSEIHDIDNIVSKCHEKNVKVTLAIGGATKSEAFGEICNSKQLRTTFINNVLVYCKKHNVDGIDIDWEHWATPETAHKEEGDSMLVFFKEFYAVTQKNNIWFSYCVYGSNWYGKHYNSQLINYADEIIVMAYDAAGGWSSIGHHAPMSFFESAHAYWVGRLGKENAHKINMGIPFYGIRYDNTHKAGSVGTFEATAYNDILAEFPKAYENDTLKTKRSITIHNGKNTLKKKVDFVKNNNSMGMLIWEIAHDFKTKDQSLLKFVSKELRK